MRANVAELNREVEQLTRELQIVSKNARRDTLRILKKSAKPFVFALEINAPESERPHKRYSTAKLVRRIRAPKGRGNVVATYMPGNLGASFQFLNFRGAKYQVTVGAKLAKGNSQGVFGPGGRTDGYYAHMVEKGTKNSRARPFVLPTWNRYREATRRAVVEEFKKKIQRLKR